jgi:hypothetical protein
MTFVLALTGMTTVALLAQAPPIASGMNISERIACGPISLPAPPAAGIRVLGGYIRSRRMFGPGEALIINAGSQQGLQTGQRFYVRRHLQDRFSPAALLLHSIHTAGWVTIVDVKDTLAVATVTHACDGIQEGDYLEPYTDAIVPPAALPGAPDFAHPGVIIMADERRQMGYPGLVMIVNRGLDHNVRAGQGLTIYRETLGGGGPLLTLGTGTVLTVSPQTSLIRIDGARDAIFLGDMVAIHRITQ